MKEVRSQKSVISYQLSVINKLKLFSVHCSLFTVFCLLFTVFTGCAARRHYVQPNPANPIRTVAVLPMVNQTNDIEGPEKARAMFAEQLVERQYVVKPIAEVNQILKDELGITLGSQLDMTNPQELGQKLGVDGVIYGTLFDFDEKTTGVLNIRRVKAGFKLVDAKTGAVIWGKGQGVRSETRMARGNTGALAGAASEISKAQDIREGKEMKDIGDYIGVQNWHNLPPQEALSEQVGQGGVIAAFASGLAERAVKKAAGIFLMRESEIMIDMIIKTLPPGPGK